MQDPSSGNRDMSSPAASSHRLSPCASHLEAMSAWISSPRSSSPRHPIGSHAKHSSDISSGVYLPADRASCTYIPCGTAGGGSRTACPSYLPTVKMQIVACLTFDNLPLQCHHRPCPNPSFKKLLHLHGHSRGRHPNRSNRSAPPSTRLCGRSHHAHDS